MLSSGCRGVRGTRSCRVVAGRCEALLLVACLGGAWFCREGVLKDVLKKACSRLRRTLGGDGLIDFLSRNLFGVQNLGALDA